MSQLTPRWNDFGLLRHILKEIEIKTRNKDIMGLQLILFLNSVKSIRLLFLLGVMIPTLGMCNSVMNSMFTKEYPEQEGGSMLGALSRAQQFYFTEYNEFALTFQDLEVPINSKYYQFSIVSPLNTHQGGDKARITGVIMTAYPQQEQIATHQDIPIQINGTFFDAQERQFLTQTCRLSKQKQSELDSNHLSHSLLLPSQWLIYPYKTDIELKQTELEVNNILTCPDGFQPVH